MTLPSLNLFYCAYEARQTPHKAVEYLGRAIRLLDLSLPPIEAWKGNSTTGVFCAYAEVLMRLGMVIVDFDGRVSESLWQALECTRVDTVQWWRKTREVRAAA